MKHLTLGTGPRAPLEGNVRGMKRVARSEIQFRPAAAGFSSVAEARKIERLIIKWRLHVVKFNFLPATRRHRALLQTSHVLRVMVLFRTLSLLFPRNLNRS